MKEPSIKVRLTETQWVGVLASLHATTTQLTTALQENRASVNDDDRDALHALVEAQCTIVSAMVESGAMGRTAEEKAGLPALPELKLQLERLLGG